MKRILALIIVVALTISSSTDLLAKNYEVENPEKTYSKVKLVKTEKDINKYLRDNMKLKDKLEKEMEKINKSYTISSVQEVEYIVAENYETIDGKSTVTESRLLTNQEVNELEKKSDFSFLKQFGATDVQASSNYDSESKFRLTISLTRVDFGGNEYYIMGDASWSGIDPNPFDQEEGASYGEDCMAITWGGDGELKKYAYSTSGNYTVNNTPIDFYREISDTYKGYAWCFDERYVEPSGHAVYADDISTNVWLKKTYSTIKNKETNAKLTYIHTYKNITLSPTISGSGSLAGSIQPGTSSGSWPIEIDVSELEY